MTGDIIPLPGNPHREVEALLPWYVTGQLDAADRARIEAHLSQCAECRAQHVLERRIEGEVTRRPADVEEGWAAMRQRLARDHGRVPVASEIVQSVDQPDRIRRKAWKWFGWGVGAQLALASLLAFVVLQPASQTATFHALGASAASPAGNLVVIFQPDTSELIMRRTLRENDARLVDGPTAANAYILQVPDTGRAAALSRLRGQRQVILAEPLDPGARL